MRRRKTARYSGKCQVTPQYIVGYKPSVLFLDELPESSDAIRARVEAARAVQRQRYGDAGIRCNAELSARTLPKFCGLTPSARELLNASTERMKLSNRAYTRVLKVARTICDLDGVDEIGDAQVAEAVQYRALDRKYWG